MGNADRPDATAPHDGPVTKAETPDGLVKLRAHGIPDQGGLLTLRQAEASNAAGVSGLPHFEVAQQGETVASLLKQFAATEAIAGSIGVVGGAGYAGVIGKGAGKIAELFLKPVSRLSVSSELALGMAKEGGIRGGVVGLAVGVVAFAGYEGYQHYFGSNSPEHRPEKKP